MINEVSITYVNDDAKFEQHLFDVSTTLYGNDFVLDAICSGMKSRFTMFNFYHKFNKTNGSVGIYVSSDKVDVTTMKDWFLGKTII